MRVQTEASSGSIARKENPLKAPNRTFQMFAEETRETTNVVSSKFHVNSFSMHVLFDSGANHSFVSRNFLQEIHYVYHNRN